MRGVALCFVLLLAGAAAPTGNSAEPQGETPSCTSGVFTPQPPPDRPARARDVTLRVSSQWAIHRAHNVTWVLTLRNRTNKALGLNFLSSKYADVALRRQGTTVYSWASGKGFYQAFWSRKLAPHETYACSLAPDELDFDSLETGRYELIAGLNLADLRVQVRRPLSITQG